MALESTGIGFVLQSEQRGTGHAMMEAADALNGFDHVLVLSGDVPLITPETIAGVRDFHLDATPRMTILTAEPADPTGYGRIFRKRAAGTETDEVERIVEQKALRGEEAEQREINSGIYAFATGPLYAQIGKIGTDNAHREYYLTDIAALLGKAGEKVLALRAEDSNEVLGVNTRMELAELDAQASRQESARTHAGRHNHLSSRNLRHRRRRRDRYRYRDRAVCATHRQNQDRRRLPHSLLFRHHELRDSATRF